MAKVLLVDDEQNIRWTMSELLKRRGYDAVSAADYDSAVEILDKETIDVAVVDVILPGTNGLELLKEINARGQYIPVLIMTGEPNLGQVPDILRGGAYDFMAKPVVKETLLQAVAGALERKRLVDEKRVLDEEIKLHADHLEMIVQERTRELGEAHDFLNAVLDSSTGYAVVATDVSNAITLFNRGAEQIFGYANSYALGMTVDHLFADDQYAVRVAPEFVTGLNDRGGYQDTMNFLRASGDLFVSALTVTTIRNSSGEMLGYLYIVKDLSEEIQKETEIKEMETRLQAAERTAALGRAAAQIAHEVKNPLAGLKLYSLHLKSKLAGGEPSQELLAEKIVNTIDHLSETVERVLNFARPLNPEPSQVDLNELVSDALQLLENQISGFEIERDIVLSPAPLFGHLDRALVRSALVNLILNSIQAMPRGGTLSIKTGRDAERLFIEIVDTGCGMTEEQIRNLFEPFFTTKVRGLGLGMYYARKVVEHHRGRIDVESCEGTGTRVRLVFP